MKLYKGISKLPQYKCWVNMMRRCYYPDEHHKKYYNNINVCEEWKNSVNFCKWAEQNGFKKGLTLDRINVFDDYKPENCRFVTFKEQLKNNRRNLTSLTIDGETKTITEWARENGIRENTIRMRIKYGYIGKDLIKPTKKYNKEHSYWEGR